MENQHDAAAAFRRAAQQSESINEVEQTKPVINWLDFVVDFTQPEPEPEFLLEIDGVGVIPAGGLTLVTGAAKQGKTQWLAAMIATAISGQSFGGMRCRNRVKSCLWIDTEQSRYDIGRTINRVYALAGIERGTASQAAGLHVLGLFELDPADRREAIEQAVLNIKPELLVIDGVRDLMHDFNSIDDTAALIEWQNWLRGSVPGMRLIEVLHTNPGGDKMRGHLGTELNNKLTDKFTVKKENGIFTVTHESRGREITTPFAFAIDAAGQLISSTVEAAAGVVDADTAIAEVFPEYGDPDKPGREFVDALKEYAKRCGLTQKRAREALKARINAGEIVKAADRLFYRRAAEPQSTIFHPDSSTDPKP